MATIKSEIGRLAEDLTTRYLEGKGYKILFRNYRKPWGEIDIVAKQGPAIAFIEVKANKTDYAHFQPEVRANREKMNKVIRTAKTYLAQFGLDNVEWRLDVVSVIFDKEKGRAKIKHFINIDPD
jgi:putative endonuclease